ncbi:metal-dependent hydrolase family protein [Sphingomicrobium arenosum]|uniref:metal-dependent hydrolase family protein n=1 Tax=Sphingomicrobium arenosum TaxID=2233861 RepID=UPI00223F19F4|nr:amidohydrolase family protein [Sphingomicrobium arenosum]
MGIATKGLIGGLVAALLASGAQAAPQVIHAGRLIAVPGEAVRGPSTIIVDDGRIISLADGFADVPAGATLIDLSDKTVLPGLIDAHVHLTSDSTGNAGFLEGFVRTDNWYTLNAYVNGMKTLRAGFTTVRNLGDGTGATEALSTAVAEGLVMGPRILDAGMPISTTAGHMDGAVGLRPDFRPMMELNGNTCDGPADCRRAVREQVANGADVIKFAITGGVNSRIGAGLGAQMHMDEARAIVETARLYDKRIAVHAHGADGALMAVQLGVDSIEHGTILSDELVRAWAASDTYYVPTLMTVNSYHARVAAGIENEAPSVAEKIQWRIGITGKSLQRLVPAGVKIAFGTDAGVWKHGRNADEFTLMVANGMTPEAALVAATINAADLLGLSDEVGTIEPGKSADILAVTGDPLADVEVYKAPAFVMARGQVVDLEN